MLVPVIVMASAGLAAGICLAVASRYFNVEKDWRVEAVNRCFSGANCGGCGYPGCAALAAAVVRGEAPVNACPGASAEDVEKIAAIMGTEAKTAVNKIAAVLCGGGKNASDRYQYYGLKDCVSMSALMGGVKNCAFGCVGGGSCVRACPFGAMEMGGDGLPVVSRELCTGCGLCVPECPRGLIILKESFERVCVLCSSLDKGPETRKICTAGCMGCKICEKVCPAQAVSVSGFLAVIDGEKCTACGECVKNCPVSAIKFIGCSLKR